MKRFILSLLCLAPTLGYALENTANEISDQCLKSVRNLYQFYFYEISPNEKQARCNPVPETMDPKTSLEMKVVIAELRQSCSPELIARINQTFKEETS